MTMRGPDMKNEAIVPSDVSKSSIQEVVIGIWKELLGVEEVGPDDNFLLLGGESLLATQASARLCDKYGLEMPLRSILIGTVGQLAQEIAVEIKAAAK